MWFVCVWLGLWLCVCVCVCGWVWLGVGVWLCVCLWLCVHVRACVFRVGADITVLREREVDYDSDEPHRIAEVLIRKVPDDQQVIVWCLCLAHLMCLMLSGLC